MVSLGVWFSGCQGWHYLGFRINTTTAESITLLHGVFAIWSQLSLRYRTLFWGALQFSTTRFPSLELLTAGLRPPGTCACTLFIFSPFHRKVSDCMALFLISAFPFNFWHYFWGINRGNICHTLDMGNLPAYTTTREVRHHLARHLPELIKGDLLLSLYPPFLTRRQFYKQTFLLVTHPQHRWR